MQKKRPSPSLFYACAALAACAATPATWAAGWASGGSGATLGQPLDFTVQMRLDAGEALGPDCVSAEVTIGERRLAAGAVRTAVEMIGAELARIRVSTQVSVDEPVVGVQVQAGCNGRLSRRFVVLADPPEFRAAPVAAAAVYAPAFAAQPVDVPATGGAADDRPSTRSLAPNDGAMVPAAAVQRVASRAQVRPAPSARQASRAERRAERRAAAQRAVPAPVAAVARQLPRVVAAAAPRLQLDVAEPAPSVQTVVLDQAIEAVAQAASAARAAAASASAASDRIAGLERTVDGLRSEAKASRDLATQLRQRLASAEDAGRWTWPLLAAVLVLTAIAAWLALRLNGAQRVRQSDWRESLQGGSGLPMTRSQPAQEPSPSKQATAPIPFVTSELKAPDTAPPRARASTQPAWPPPAPPEVPLLPVEATQPLPMEPAPEFPYDTAMQRTEPLPPRATQGGARDMSIEELIDLEQQAEFFVVLGQDEAAVDLLVEHLRQTGGGSPLPYLKLLEIYRRRGDRSDYERMRGRFNHRFNGYAPDWDADLQAGRSLEDYPGVLPRLQQLWDRPLDAMAELEALLFRKSSRGELFELPAYREVLFLYSLARDLLDREAADTGNVDLLLPMADGTEFSSTSPAPYLGLERDSGFGPHPEFDDRPTAPVDFDLSVDIDRPTSIFDTLDAIAEAPRRR